MYIHICMYIYICMYIFEALLRNNILCKHSPLFCNKPPSAKPPTTILWATTTSLTTATKLLSFVVECVCLVCVWVFWCFAILCRLCFCRVCCVRVTCWLFCNILHDARYYHLLHPPAQFWVSLEVLRVFVLLLGVEFRRRRGVWKQNPFSTRKRGIVAHYCAILSSQPPVIANNIAQYRSPMTLSIAINYWQYRVKAKTGPRGRKSWPVHDIVIVIIVWHVLQYRMDGE